jgi:hypothetical protein
LRFSIFFNFAFNSSRVAIVAAQTIYQTILGSIQPILRIDRFDSEVYINLYHERHHDLLSLRPSIGGHLQINLVFTITTSPTFFTNE